MMAARIKKGDTVVVLAGKDKGKRGQVTEVLTRLDKVIVEGINSVITHKKQTKDSAGGRIPKNAPVHVSNVALLDPKNDVATRVGFSIKDGKKVRVAKKSGRYRCNYRPRLEKLYNDEFRSSLKDQFNYKNA